MAHYGKMLDAFEPEKELIYQSFVEYLNNPVLEKTKDTQGLSMYMTKTFCLLSNECRYIIVLVKKDKNTVGFRQNLQNMFWVSLQTRTLPQKGDCNTNHSYTPKHGGEIDTPIKRDDYNERASNYSCEKFPNLLVTLLHTKEGPREYQDKGSIITALETYQTVVCFK